MLYKIGSLFLVLVFVFFILLYPDRIVDFLQAFVDAARRVAQELGEMSLHSETSGMTGRIP